jgi:hypothetical protein
VDVVDGLADLLLEVAGERRHFRRREKREREEESGGSWTFRDVEQFVFRKVDFPAKAKGIVVDCCCGDLVGCV